MSRSSRSIFHLSPPLTLSLCFVVFLFVLAVTAAESTGPGNDSQHDAPLILSARRTRRRDPLNNFKYYTDGYNISNKHYWASVGLTAAPFFAVGVAWFLVFGVCLAFIGLCFCCCQREPYGYSRGCYAISLIFLVLCTIAAVVGCIILYVGQVKFHRASTDTLDYIVNQADDTTANLRNVSEYLSDAKQISVESLFLPSKTQSDIDKIDLKINSSANTLSSKTKKNSKDIENALDTTRLILIILAAVMLGLAFLGFVLSLFGLQCPVYFLIVIGWILVTGTFILCGVFFLLHNVTADTCIAMDEWVQHPSAKTAMDKIIPCVDKETSRQTLNQTKAVSYSIVNVLDNIITNVSNRNFPPTLTSLYFNQSGPLVPPLCNPVNPDFTSRQCSSSEVNLSSANQVWKKYTCAVSSSGICTTSGRLTPTLYNQMASAVNISYALYRYGPFLVDLQDCSFVRQTFGNISTTYCPKLRRHTEWIYVGLVIVAVSVMLSLIFWVIYARERRHRVYSKEHQPL